ncbi:GerMN domain-containing protein [Granulicella cerasi]|uniref:GerMN domain-containing protein n=1 Tax=Granulicella cerasi TaxID=741063 RepID=A0ABW1Z611_9BACT|nr:GerMN domain-containing protein [Granulicella cerasi]
MISRHQRILFWLLVLAIFGMGAWLWHVHQRERDRMHAIANDNTPLDAPYSGSESITFALADDEGGTITNTPRMIAMPTEVTARARALLDDLVNIYSQPASKHPLPSGVAVDGVFLIPLPVVGHALDPKAPASPTGEHDATMLVPAAPDSPRAENPGGVLAVINLRSQFVNSHPSGVEVENLTLLSILGTLHANIPQIEQVRFLVDGQPRETLAGHVDMLRQYPTRDTASTPAPEN